MQDIHSIGSGGGGGRLFGGGDRRLRPHHGQTPPVMKCPRCESINTKFCYYNNYNLSQPRHFCKSCRRYWTKGGVLRNVPVGGGCRKTKRSKSKGTTSESDAPPKERKSSNSQNSSSESSSLTASTTAATAAANGTAAAEVLSGSSSNSASAFLNFQESRFFSFSQSTSVNPSFDPSLMDQSSETGMFPEIGTFTSLMTSSNDPMPLAFNIADISPYRLQQQQSHGHNVENQSSDQHWQQQQEKIVGNMHELGGGYLDQTVQMEFSELQNRISDDGLAAVDWQSGGDQGLFDLAGTVDQSYWNQTQWADDDHQLNYLP